VQGVPARAALILCALALALGGCGGSDEGEGGGGGKAERPANLPADFNLQLFNCSDWQESDEEVRAFVVDRLEEVVGGQITGQGASGRGSTITDEQAHRLFDGTCGSPKARGFLLYKLYGHAAGFGGGAY
jgi:hypothetical protein